MQLGRSLMPPAEEHALEDDGRWRDPAHGGPYTLRQALDTARPKARCPARGAGPRSILIRRPTLALKLLDFSRGMAPAPQRPGGRDRLAQLRERALPLRRRARRPCRWVVALPLPLAVAGGSSYRGPFLLADLRLDNLGVGRTSFSDELLVGALSRSSRRLRAR